LWIVSILRSSTASAKSLYVAAHKQSSRVFCSAKCAISKLICLPGKWLRYYAPAEFDLVAGRDRAAPIQLPDIAGESRGGETKW
jgi:hypothetical protein